MKSQLVILEYSARLDSESDHSGARFFPALLTGQVLKNAHRKPVFSSEQQLPDEQVSVYKPSVLYLLLNFQTRRMSFNVLNAAMLEVAKLRKLGLHVVTVIVDPFENRWST